MKKFISLILIISLLAIMGLSVYSCKPKEEKPAWTPKEEYKLSVVVGPTFWWGMAAQKFADDVKEKTDGKVNIKVYYGGQLFAGKQTNEFQLMASGAIDFAWGSTINWSPVIKEMNVFSLPFFINTFDNLDKMEYGETGKIIFKKMEEKGVVGLAWAENGFREITNSRREIRRPEDLKGLKIRVVGSPIFLDIYRALGADPTNMNWADAVTAFQQGTVDGQENPVGVLIPVKIWQYHKYVTFWNYLVDPVIVGVNKKIWDEFPDDIKKIIKECAEEAAEYEKALCRAGLDGDKSIKILKEKFGVTPEITDPVKYLEDNGMKVTFLTDEEREAFIEATKPVFDAWVEKIGRDVVEAAKRDMGK